MSISRADVQHVALLARLKLDDEQVTLLQGELDAILGYISEIQKLDLSGVEPTAHAIPMVNSTRPDEVRPGLSREDALRNAPEHAGGAFVIPRIVGVQEEA
ncbi:MAG: Asp-tRNA(Asn)/Glu-tRNA(Gln) amidotransferase subunit GatC [Coriobacteriales bacterium]|nr:Asp-tRNA(Asn)/Glu-tRNA(Gln) amidotransferase subunit GatC [Actinomycetes bacterium]